jgi:hypothetical protein
MSYNSLLLLIDLGFIATITALIVAVTVVLARREDQRVKSSVAVLDLRHARSGSAS